MTLLKKGSRILDIDGVEYRWRLRGRPTNSQGNACVPMYFAAELAEEPGSTLVVRTSHTHPGNWVGAPATPILPGEVAKAVRAALAGGWRPAQRGKQFLLDLSAGFTPA